MTTPAQLRSALDRAAGELSVDLDAAETRVRTLGQARLRRRRLGAIVAVGAAVVATFLAVALPLSLVGRSHPSGRIGTTTLSAGPVSSGTYLLAGFPRAATVRLPSRWTVDTAADGDVRLSRRDEPGAVLGFFVRPRVFRPGANDVAVEAPSDLVGWMKRHPDLTVLSSSPVRLGAYFGTSLELRVRPQPRTTGGTCVRQCLPLFELAGGPVTVPLNATLRVVAINVAGRLLVAYSWADASHYAAWSQIADPVIAGLRLSRQ